MALMAEHCDSEDTPIPVAIETSRGLLVSCLRATGRPVFAINPLAVARYRDRPDRLAVPAQVPGDR